MKPKPKFKVGEVVQIKSEKELTKIYRKLGWDDITYYYDRSFTIHAIELEEDAKYYTYYPKENNIKYEHYEFELKSLNKLQLSENAFRI